MRNFVAFVEGQNFKLEVNGNVKLVSYFASGCIEAETEDDDN